jgi:hypothetical protein
MPRDIETGPGNMDPITGRDAGCCNSGQSRNRATNATGRGAGSHGRCEWFNASELAGRTPKENEEKLLRDEADTLRKQLDEVGRRLNEL